MEYRIIDTGHVRFEIPKPREDDNEWKTWTYCEGLSKKEGFRIPTIEELKYLYNFQQKSGIEIQNDWVWSSKKLEDQEQSAYYYFSFATGTTSWHFAYQDSCVLVKAFDK
jgi:hypothetical protein